MNRADDDNRATNSDRDPEIRQRADQLPKGPNDDMGNLAKPPVEVEEPRVSDDNDLNPAGGGLSDTPLRRPYDQMSRRDEIARQLEEVVINAQEWADENGTPEAIDIYEALNEVYQRIGEPSEDTDD